MPVPVPAPMPAPMPSTGTTRDSPSCEIVDLQLGTLA